jgi:transcription initiation factor IIE alpha subunit
MKLDTVLVGRELDNHHIAMECVMQGDDVINDELHGLEKLKERLVAKVLRDSDNAGIVTCVWVSGRKMRTR